jgi:two-component system response regulator DevR
MAATRIAIIEDEQEIRECLAILLQSSPGLSLVGTFGTMTAALARLPVDRPDVALVDIGLPICRGSKACGG